VNLNKVFLIGRLTNNPQLKTLPSGTQVCSFGLATDRFFTDKTGQKKQETEFSNIVLFGRLAEIASQYLTKGSLTFIEGRLRTRNWQDQSGNKRYRTEIIAERLQLGPKAAGEQIPAVPEPTPSVPEQTPQATEEEIPIIEEEKEINPKDIPF